MKMRRFSLPLVALVVALVYFAGCAPLNDPYYSGSRDPYYDPYERDRYYERERWETERERRRLEEERRRLEDERRHHNQPYTPPPPPLRPSAPPPPPPRQEQCPPGFSPSERKCSDKERKHGCKDMRLPGGLGCVKR